MKKLLLLLLLLYLSQAGEAQTISDAKEGTVSYITSQNVYVKFESTDNISVGDTLYASEGANLIPVLVVKNLSSISCVCVSISSKKLSVSDKISSGPKSKPSAATDAPALIPVQPLVIKTDSVPGETDQPKELQQNINGRISISSYSNFSNVADFSQRMRYTLSLNIKNIGKSKLSSETYISFVHKINEWSDIQEDIFNGLKIYSLAINYEPDKKNSLWFGRKINPRLSNVGAIDGVQYAHNFKSVVTGIFAGTRPDYMNYSFNPNLLQYGGYIGYDYSAAKGNMQNTLAFIEQKNNGNTDRRFAYLQHSNSLIPNLNFFGSVEFDLYNKVMNAQDSALTQDNTPSLTNVYVSVRYKIIRQLSISLSYSARQNIIYYETYKNIIDQLLEAATLQGYMFQVNYRPVKNISVGVNAGYRNSKNDPKPTKNLYSYITYANIPGINSSATLSATLLETSYMNGNIYSLGLARELIPAKLSGGMSYRYVKYKFVSNETPLVQNMAEINFTWRIMKKLSCSLNYEGTFEKDTNYDRIYVNLTRRF